MTKCEWCGKPLFGFGRCKCAIKQPASKVVLLAPEVTEQLCFVLGQMRSRDANDKEDIPCGA